jgi:hypothetical protein
LTHYSHTNSIDDNVLYNDDPSDDCNYHYHITDTVADYNHTTTNNHNSIDDNVLYNDDPSDDYNKHYNVNDRLVPIRTFRPPEKDESYWMILHRRESFGM